MKKKKKKGALQKRRAPRSRFYLPPTWGKKPPEDLARYLARHSRSFPQAAGRLLSLFDRWGFCNQASRKYSPELCARREAILVLLKEIMGGELRESSWVQKVRTKWRPPKGLFTRSPEEIASVLAGASKSYAQAVARVNFYYNRAGFCDPDSPRYNPEECAKRDEVLQRLRDIFHVEESEKAPREKFPASPGSQAFLRYLSDAFRSPVRLAFWIYDMENPDDFEETDRLPVLRTRFNTAYNSIVQLVGICDPKSPFYRPKICAELPRHRRQVWRIYYNLILGDWAKGQKHVKELPDEGGE